MKGWRERAAEMEFLGATLPKPPLAMPRLYNEHRLGYSKLSIRVWRVRMRLCRWRVRDLTGGGSGCRNSAGGVICEGICVSAER